ncbi:MAG: hypothetical protein PHF95_06490 [bacterium]|nr:hypothetical protein [bacterium]
MRKVKFFRVSNSSTELSENALEKAINSWLEKSDKNILIINIIPMMFPVVKSGWGGFGSGFFEPGVAVLYKLTDK